MIQTKRVKSRHTFTALKNLWNGCFKFAHDILKYILREGLDQFIWCILFIKFLITINMCLKFPIILKRVEIVSECTSNGYWFKDNWQYNIVIQIAVHKIERSNTMVKSSALVLEWSCNIKNMVLSYQSNDIPALWWYNLVYVSLFVTLPT